MSAPSVAEINAYLGDDHSWTSSQIEDALAAESQAQARTCRIPSGEWPADLSEALYRRVARNLAMRNLPLGIEMQMSEGGGVVARPGRDYEVARLEAPYRRWVIA